MREPDELRGLGRFVNDASFLQRWQEIRRDNKRVLAARLRRKTGVACDPDSMFDVQVKRIHAYKRQQLNVLHLIALYLRLRDDPSFDVAPRTLVFGGNTAPAYRMAKLIIKLINSAGDVVNRDPAIRDEAARGRGISRPRALDAHVDPQHRALGEILRGPQHPGVRSGPMEGRTDADPPARAGGGEGRGHPVEIPCSQRRR